MKHIAIIGGGVSGLVAAHIFAQYDFRRKYRIVVYEANKVGGEFASGGLKYIHRTDGMVRLFNSLKIPYSNYTVRGGILLRGQVLSYPRCFEGMQPLERTRIRHDHYKKTRRSNPGAWSEKSMNDPSAIKPRRALRCDLDELIDKLASGVEIVKDEFVKMGDGTVSFKKLHKVPFDFLIFTVPLWVLRRNVRFYVPHGITMKLNIARIVPVKDKYVKWDYVYTPYTPDNCIHRFSPTANGYSIECNGELDRVALESDLSFLFPDGHFISDIKTGLKGHLLPLKHQPDWPWNVAPLGRFAQWDPRATVDVVEENARKLAEKWL